jgi:hypothetical protein
VKYYYLLSAGIFISLVHIYLVWVHRANRKYSLSEHAIIDKKSQLLYLVAHIICDVLFLLYSYQFFVIEQRLLLPHYLNISFVLFDFIQAALPSRSKTEKIHFAAAYISWLSYLLAGIVALFVLNIAEPYKTIAILLLVPILSMFAYMHYNRSKLYPYQVLIVPLFVIYMLLVTIGTI